jgi:predicted TPR repeat methyltransferase
MDQVCGICGGPLHLRHRGSGAALTAAVLSPSCHAVGGHGDLLECAVCGTVQQPERPADGTLADLYREMRDDDYLGEDAGRRATARRLLDRVERVRPGGRLLDVGCGHGLLVDEARRRGWDARGLEVAADAAAYARDVLGLDVREEPVEALDPERDGPFDAIVLADVIEHLDDPVSVVRSCAALLADGGALCVVTPDPGSRTARVAGARWWALLPGHTFLLPRRTLRALLAGEGLEVVDDSGLRRTFSLGYWMAGLGERSGGVGRALGALGRTPAGRAPVTLSLGDERVVIARRG